MHGAAPAAARCAVERSDEYLCTGGAYRRHIKEYVSTRALSGSIVPFVPFLEMYSCGQHLMVHVELLIQLFFFSKVIFTVVSVMSK